MKMPSERVLSITSTDEAADYAEYCFKTAALLLCECATLLRGKLIQPTVQTMKTEIAVSNAIDALRNGFNVPKNG